MTKAVDKFLNELLTTEFEDSFNPYRHVCSVYDQDTSPNIRLNILKDLLKSATTKQVDAIWIGRDLGHRGGRRTGLALTDDLSFHKHLSRWGVVSPHPTNGPKVKEQTATAIWEILNKVPQNIFLWNVFPFHPYRKGDQFSNRAHNATERNYGTELLGQLVDLLKPKRVVAIGNDAAGAAKSLARKCETVHVRHPSYGGKPEFTQKISRMYQIQVQDAQQRLI